MCAIFVMWKERNKQKEAGLGPFLKKNSLQELVRTPPIYKKEENQNSKI